MLDFTISKLVHVVVLHGIVKVCRYIIINAFFGYAKYSSVTNMLLELKLPRLNTIT